jgi:hypothetical protein
MNQRRVPGLMGALCPIDDGVRGGLTTSPQASLPACPAVGPSALGILSDGCGGIEPPPCGRCAVSHGDFRAASQGPGCIARRTEVAADTVYVLNTGAFRSTNGGKDFELLPAPHGDHHALWIDPRDRRCLRSAQHWEPAS